MNDQKRTATAQEAIEAGANYIVVGRPIIEAKDPLKAVEELIT
ncbi:MAG: orotidine 5'-phosphate decarboxylase / HUMPS family protein [Candidatus Omnitrophota bacterium]